MAGRRRFDDIRGAKCCLVVVSLGISVSVAVTVAGYTVEASQDLGLRNCRARQACKQSPTSTGRTRRHSVDPVFLMAARMRRRGSEAVLTTGMVKLDVRVPRLHVSCLPPASRLRLDCSVSIP